MKRDLESPLEQWFSFFFFSGAKVASTTQCMTCRSLNFDGVNLVFAALSLIFRGHEAGLSHAY